MAAAHDFNHEILLLNLLLLNFLNRMQKETEAIKMRVKLLDESRFDPRGSVTRIVQREAAEELQADYLKGKLNHSRGTVRVCSLFSCIFLCG